MMNHDSTFRLTVLGTRGSIPVDGDRFRVYGGATSCYMVQAEDTTVFLDAGSGIIFAPDELPSPPLILVSHLHLDHVIGLGMYPRLSVPGERTNLFLPHLPGYSTRDTLSMLYSPPLWPLNLTAYAGELLYFQATLPFTYGGIEIEGIPGNHPGDAIIFRLSHGGKSIVYATDFEHGTLKDAELASFAEGADLLLYDAQYSGEESARRKGFGHSTAEEGIAIMHRCRAKRLLLIHHDPHSTDSIIAEREKQFSTDTIHYARQGEVIDL